MHTRRDGTSVEYTYEHSSWYDLYVSNPRPDDKQFNKLFRKRFGCLYPVFVNMVAHATLDPRFPRWLGCD